MNELTPDVLKSVIIEDAPQNVVSFGIGFYRKLIAAWEADKQRIAELEAEVRFLIQEREVVNGVSDIKPEGLLAYDGFNKADK